MYYVPPMAQRNTSYDSARSLLDAIRIKNQREASDRSLKLQNKYLDIAETEALNRQKLFERQEATRDAINTVLRDTIKTRESDEAKKKRMAQSGSGGSWPYQITQWLVDKSPLPTYTPKRGWQYESKEERINRESGPATDFTKSIDHPAFQDPDIDLQSLKPLFHGPQNLLNNIMLNSNQSQFQPQFQQRFDPQTDIYK